MPLHPLGALQSVRAAPEKGRGVLVQFCHGNRAPQMTLSPFNGTGALIQGITVCFKANRVFPANRHDQRASGFLIGHGPVHLGPTTVHPFSLHAPDFLVPQVAAAGKPQIVNSL